LHHHSLTCHAIDCCQGITKFEQTSSSKIAKVSYACKKNRRLIFPTLSVLTAQAEGLLAKDRSGTSDPFCEIHVGGELNVAHKTRVMDKTLHPEWNQTFTLHHSVRVLMSADVDILSRLRFLKLKMLPGSSLLGVIDVQFNLTFCHAIQSIVFCQSSQGESPETNSLDIALYDHDKGVFKDSQV
jgi:hypothetical protein